MKRRKRTDLGQRWGWETLERKGLSLERFQEDYWHDLRQRWPTSLTSGEGVRSGEGYFVTMIQRTVR